MPIIIILLFFRNLTGAIFGTLGQFEISKVIGYEKVRTKVPRSEVIEFITKAFISLKLEPKYSASYNFRKQLV